MDISAVVRARLPWAAAFDGAAAALQAAEMRRRDTRPPVILLRSFGDDVIGVDRGPTVNTPLSFWEKSLVHASAFERGDAYPKRLPVDAIRVDRRPPPTV